MARMSRGATSGRVADALGVVGSGFALVMLIAMRAF
jgi:hypothetical protein